MRLLSVPLARRRASGSRAVRCCKTEYMPRRTQAAQCPRRRSAPGPADLQALAHAPLPPTAARHACCSCRGEDGSCGGRREDAMKRLWIAGLLVLGAAAAAPAPASADWRVAIGVSHDHGDDGARGPRSATGTTGAGARARRKGTATGGAAATRASGASGELPATATAATSGCDGPALRTTPPASADGLRGGLPARLRSGGATALRAAAIRRADDRDGGRYGHDRVTGGYERGTTPATGSERSADSLPRQRAGVRACDQHALAAPAHVGIVGRLL